MQKPERKQGRNAVLDDYALPYRPDLLGMPSQVPGGRASAPFASSPKSVTPAVAGGDLISACSAAVGELSASRELISTLDAENAALKQRLETEKRTTSLLGELNETRKSEIEALRSALAAKNEALTAKDTVIASQDKLIETLKRKKSSPWKRLTDVLIGIGVGVLLH